MSNVFIDIEGGERVDVGGMRVDFKDRWGEHSGIVGEFKRTSETGGSASGFGRMVYTVKCDDGKERELRPWELRDIVRANH